MEAVSSDRTLLKEILNRFTEPAKYKIKLYQIAVLMYIDQILTLLINKYMFFRVAIEEKKTNLKIASFEQTQIKLDLFSKENIKRTLVLVEKIKTEAHVKFESLQSMHEHCVTHEATPELFCEPYIHTGFRPINRPYTYYMKSLFFKHNETINAWSHYIGAMYTLYLAFTMDFTDPYSWPILTCLITATIMFFTSATAHLMHQKSHYCHMTCFLCDFGGISFNGYGAAFMQTYMCSPIWYYAIVEPYLVPLIGFMSMLCCIFNSLAQTLYSRPYPPMKRFLQFAPCGVLWTFTMLPVLVRLFVSETTEVGETTVSYDYHIAHLVTFLAGAVCFALDFPQRFLPGRLDFFGQGHNLFHLCIFLVVAFQFKACHADYLANRELIAATREPPTFAFCFLSLLGLIAYYAYVTYQFNRMIAHNFDDEGNLIPGKQEEIERKQLHPEEKHEQDSEELANNEQEVTFDIDIDEEIVIDKTPELQFIETPTHTKSE